MKKSTEKQFTSKSSYRGPAIFKQLPIVALTLVSITAVANEFDSRQVIELDQKNKAQLLSNMRDTFSSTQSIMSALVAEDMQAVVQYARPLGFKARKEQGPDELHSMLPKSFKMLGKAMHQDFDKIADDAETLQDPKHTLQQLTAVLNSCQGCHATFQIDSAMTNIENNSQSK